MTYLIWIGIAVFVGLALLHGTIQGILLGRRFRWVTKCPDEAYAWFRDHGEWLVFETTDMQYISGQLPKAKLIGPIRFVVPNLGHREIIAYGLFPQAEGSWLEFENEMKKEDKA